MTLDMNDVLRLHGKERAHQVIERGSSKPFDRRFLLTPLQAIRST